MTLQELNALEEPRAVEALMKCCGSARWAMAVARRRPFTDADALFICAEEAWSHCGKADFFEAFSHHPKIGERKVSGWAKDEQAGAAGASQATLDALMTGNAAYEKKFGHVFLVCAAGKAAEEMLGLLKARLPHDAEAELAVAAAEQAKITRLRLEKLLSP